MENVIIKYTKQQYLDKIRQIEGCISNLENHLDTLQTLKSQVQQFWDDPQTPDYLRQLTTAIVGVRNAHTRTTKLLAEYNGMVEEMEGVKAVSTDIVGDIGSIIGSLGIIE